MMSTATVERKDLDEIGLFLDLLSLEIYLLHCFCWVMEREQLQLIVARLERFLYQLCFVQVHLNA